MKFQKFKGKQVAVFGKDTIGYSIVYNRWNYERVIEMEYISEKGKDVMNQSQSDLTQTILLQSVYFQELTNNAFTSDCWLYSKKCQICPPSDLFHSFILL